MLAGGLIGGAPAVSAQSAPAVVVLVHGVRGLVADIYLDGKLVLATFQPERSTDPLQLVAGQHTVDVRPAGAPASSPPLLHAVVNLTAGVRESAVVHLDAQGQPAVTLFRDDLTRVAAGETRIVIRHAAASAPIIVAVDNHATVSGLANGQQHALVTTAGSHQVSVSAATGGLLPPQDIPFEEGSATFLYLIGSQPAGSLAWSAVKVAGLQSAPSRVQTGDGSLRSGTNRSTLTLAVALLAIAMLAGYGATRARWARRGL
jgi:Domain of unknown function (DUF4397)